MFRHLNLYDFGMLGQKKFSKTYIIVAILDAILDFEIPKNAQTS